MGLLKGPKGLTDEFYGFIKSRKRLDSHSNEWVPATGNTHTVSPTGTYSTGNLGTQIIVITGYVFIYKRNRTDKSANSFIGY